MKKLLIVGDFSSGSGLTAVIMNTFGKFNQDKYRISAVGYGRDIAGNVTGQVAKLGWRLTRSPKVTKHPLRHWLFWLKFFKENSFDFVYFNYSSSWNFLPVLLAKRYSHGKVLVHSHNTYFSHSFSNSLLMKMLIVLNKVGRRAIARAADVLIATSEEAAIWMFGQQSLYRVHIITNGIKLQKYRFSVTYRENIRTRYQISSTTKVIGFVGVLGERKNPFFAISTFEAFHAEHPDSLLVMLGKGPLKSKVTAYVKEAGLQEHFIHFDYVNNVNEWYSAMDALIFPSQFEGFGLVPLEAQVSNLKVLCSDAVPKIVFVTSNITSLPVVNSNVWAKKLATVLENTSNRNYFDDQLEKFSDLRQIATMEQLLK
ncbi:MAG: glycosyltransferase [Lactobacillus sp.]